MSKWITILVSPPILMTSKNWLFIWSILEINTFAFISLMNKKNESEEMMKYFLIQSMASMMIILAMSMKMFTESSMSMFSWDTSILLVFSMIIKSGAAPTYQWMPPIIRKMSWQNTLIFLSLQKMAPTFLLLKTSSLMMMNIIINLSILMGTILQLMTLNLKTLMTYSSISHMSWMLLSGEKSTKMFMFYFLIYSTILAMITNECSKTNIKYLSKENISKSLMMNVMSFSGIPPLLGFMPKWLILMFITESKFNKMTMLLMIMMSCVNIFIYFRIFYLKMLNKQNTKKSLNNSKLFTMSSNINMVSFLMLISTPMLL
uniref:NADH-ubiquinone oxidoreductase chain 2 n=1 Tax=Unionicola parkeri TaxID=350891 RepID=E3W3M6_9ACAR|nr:NADH dehydrogenase subunit 2 [Unionicola parkeri]ADP01836.1 NADH dehydrogenase subunit 2 [Unionicola parkeri]